MFFNGRPKPGEERRGGRPSEGKDRKASRSGWGERSKYATRDRKNRPLTSSCPFVKKGTKRGCVHRATTEQVSARGKDNRVDF